MYVKNGDAVAARRYHWVLMAFRRQVILRRAPSRARTRYGGLPFATQGEQVELAPEMGSARRAGWNKRMKPRKPIFYDEQRRRWRRTSRVLEICGAIFTFLLITFFISILVSPSLPEPLLPTNRNALHPVVEKNRTRIALKRTGRRGPVAALGEMPSTYDPVRAAFYVSWDPTSLAALQQPFRDIDLLIPERLHSITAEGRLDIEAHAKLAAWQQSLLQQTPPIEIPTMPLLNNSDGTNWLTDKMASMLKSSTARAHLA